MTISLFSDDLEINKHKKTIDWDRESIYDLIDMLHANPHHKSLIEAEYPVPPTVKAKFPFVITMDKSGRCLTSIVEMSVDMLSDLQVKASLEKELADIIDLNYINGKEKVGGMIFNVGNLLIGDQLKTCYMERLYDRAYIYSSADDCPSLPEFDKNKPVQWYIVTPEHELKSNTASSFEQALIHCGLSSSTI